MTWPFAEVAGIAALSLRVAFLATAAACVLGLPAGIWLGTTAFAGRRALLLLLNAALAVPTVVIGLLIYLLLSRHGPLGVLGLLFTWQAIVLAEIVLAFPIAAALSAAAVQAADPRVRRTALTLTPASTRCKSTNSLPGAANTQRAALEATRVSKCSRLMSRLSASCASGMGAVTRRMGSWGKNTVPSGIAWTSPVKRKSRKVSKNRAVKPPWACSQARSSSENFRSSK